ncbi:hypothetical protein Slin15195_G085380 [Septoria linicola]|uniref:Uncharacterized protein n=1 Tax=Septoria linicola TaxID=215465 RepID=A0A9Q9ATN4_9PEZI|nr:hypothetical protein Slin15195_G085380 [Septoria linicola]
MASIRYARVGYGHQDQTEYDGGAIKDTSDGASGDDRPGFYKDTLRNYRPIVLRTPSLLVLLLFTLSLIGLLQYALARLPNRQGRSGLDSLKNATADAEAFVGGRTSALGRRQESGITTSAASPSAATDAYIITIQTATNMDSTENTPSTQSSTAPDQSRPKDDYVPQTTTRTTTERVSRTETATEDLVTAAAANTEDYVPQTASVPPKTADDYIAQDIRTEPTPKTTLNEVYVRPTETVESATTTSGVYVPVTATPTHTVVTAPHPDVYVPNAETKGVEIIVWSAVQAFLGTYLAVLLAVFYRILISVVHTQIRLIDPFRQLMGSRGALASTALFSSYQSHDRFGPISALFNGRGMLFLTGLAFWLSCLLPALSSEAIFVDTNWDLPNAEIGSQTLVLPG